MRNIVYIILITASMYYTFSFAIYCWKEGNKLASIGASMIAIVAIVLPAILLYRR